jgi:hypothetical protein
MVLSKYLSGQKKTASAMTAFAVRQIRTKQTLIGIRHYSGGKCNKKTAECQANLEMSGCHGGVAIHTHHSTKSIDKRASCKTVCHPRMLLSGIWFFKQLEPDSRSESLRE